MRSNDVIENLKDAISLEDAFNTSSIYLKCIRLDIKTQLKTSGCKIAIYPKCIFKNVDREIVTMIFFEVDQFNMLMMRERLLIKEEYETTIDILNEMLYQVDTDIAESSEDIKELIVNAED